MKWNIFIFVSQSNTTQSKDLFLLISLQQVWVSPRSHCSTPHDYTTSPAKTKRLTFYSFIFSPHFTRATPDSSTARLCQSCELWTGCHCNHFLHKHTSHCRLPRWDASRDIPTLNIARWRVGVRQCQFKTIDPTPPPTRKRASRLVPFHWAQFCRTLMV